MRDDYKASGVVPYIIGFEKNQEDGKGAFLNFILSNGQRSHQTDNDYPTKYTHMMPEDAHLRIRTVEIYF